MTYLFIKKLLTKKTKNESIFTTMLTFYSLVQMQIIQKMSTRRNFKHHLCSILKTIEILLSSKNKSCCLLALAQIVVLSTYVDVSKDLLDNLIKLIVEVMKLIHFLFIYCTIIKRMKIYLKAQNPMLFQKFWLHKEFAPLNLSNIYF